MYICEGQKWDLEYEVRKKDWEVLQQISISIQYTHQSIHKETQTQKKKKTKNKKNTKTDNATYNSLVSIQYVLFSVMLSC